jgi:hypothetical protein
MEDGKYMRWVVKLTKEMDPRVGCILTQFKSAMANPRGHRVGHPPGNLGRRKRSVRYPTLLQWHSLLHLTHVQPLCHQW